MHIGAFTYSLLADLPYVTELFIHPFVQTFSTTGDSFNFCSPFNIAICQAIFELMSSNLSKECAISFPINLSALNFYAYTLMLCIAMRDAFLRVLSGALLWIALH